MSCFLEVMMKNFIKKITLSVVVLFCFSNFSYSMNSSFSMEEINKFYLNRADNMDLLQPFLMVTLFWKEKYTKFSLDQFISKKASLNKIIKGLFNNDYNKTHRDIKVLMVNIKAFTDYFIQKGLDTTIKDFKKQTPIDILKTFERVTEKRHQKLNKKLKLRKTIYEELTGKKITPYYKTIKKEKKIAKIATKAFFKINNLINRVNIQVPDHIIYEVWFSNPNNNFINPRSLLKRILLKEAEKVERSENKILKTLSKTKFFKKIKNNTEFENIHSTLQIMQAESEILKYILKHTRESLNKLKKRDSEIKTQKKMLGNKCKKFVDTKIITKK